MCLIKPCHEVLSWDPFLNWLIWFLSFFPSFVKKWLFFIFFQQLEIMVIHWSKNFLFLIVIFFSSHFLQYIKANFLSTNLIWKQSCQINSISLLSWFASVILSVTHNSLFGPHLICGGHQTCSLSNVILVYKEESAS